MVNKFDHISPSVILAHKKKTKIIAEMEQKNDRAL